MRHTLLLVHGVNSTLEWSETALRVLEPHFDCQLIRYRFFHTVWGPIKVYIWPAALLTLVTFAMAASPLLVDSMRAGEEDVWDTGARLSFDWSPQVFALWGLAALCVLQCLVVVRGEWLWSRRVDKQSPQIAIPIVFGVGGIGGVLLLPHPYTWIALGVSLASISVYLDLREYPERRLRLPTLLGFPLVVAAGLTVPLIVLLVTGTLFPAGWLALAVFAVGVAEPFWRGKLAFARVKEELADAAEREPYPFLIAHSLGTYLTGHVLWEFENLQLGRVLYTGCVLDRRHPWDAGRPDAAITVTNYVGRLDLVPFITGALRFFWVVGTCAFRLPIINRSLDFSRRFVRWRPLGMAGFAGFRVGTVVHTQKLASRCDECLKAGTDVLVHNVNHNWSAHSDINQNRDYQYWHWLACLWGIWPNELDKWFAICRLGSFASRPKQDDKGNRLRPYQMTDPTRFRNQEKMLKLRLWMWPSDIIEPPMRPGRRLVEYVRDILQEPEMPQPADFDAMMNRLPKLLFDIVTQAYDESRRREGPVDAHKVHYLHPHRALRKAVIDAI